MNTTRNFKLDRGRICKEKRNDQGHYKHSASQNVTTDSNDRSSEQLRNQVQYSKHSNSVGGDDRQSAQDFSLPPIPTP